MCTRCCWAGTALAVAAAGALQLRRLLQPRPGQGPGGTLLFKGDDFAATDDLPVLKTEVATECRAVTLPRLKG
jgi:hypothetical protein